MANRRPNASSRKTPSKHDEPLKRMYQNKKIAMSFVKTFQTALGLTPKLMGELDIEDMKLGSTEFIGEKSSKRMSDLVWEIPSRNVSHPFVLRLLVELQSTIKRNMLAKIVDYCLMLENREQQNRQPTGPEIRLRTGTVYTGKKQWAASKFREPPPSHHQSIMPLGYQYGRVIDARRISLEGLDPTELAVLAMRLEQVEAAGEAIGILGELFDHHGEDEGVCLAFYGRVAEMNFLTNADGSRVPYQQLRDQHQGGTMAEEQQTRFDEILEEHRIQARDEGLQEGLQKGQRDQLCRLAEKKFNGRTSKQLATLLKSVDDPVVLDQVAESIIGCETGKEFIKACKGLSNPH